MLESPALDLVLLAVLAALGLTAAWLDVRYRKLPNWLGGLTLLAGLLATFLTGGWGDTGSALLHCLAALLVGMGLFAFRVVGGGDAKFYTAIAAWFPLREALGLLVSVALAGLVLLLVWFVVWRGRGGKAGQEDKDDPFAKLPYGVAIACGALLTKYGVSLF